MFSIVQENPSDIDEKIVDLIQVRGRQEEGFRLLVNTYQKRLYNHIRNLVRSHEDTDDVLQNVFLKVCKHIHHFEQKSSLFTWMYTIATRESFNFLTNQKKRDSTYIFEDNIPVGKGENDLNEQAITSLLQRGIETLPEKQRLVFHMRYYDEMTYEQISAITETSVGALKASYHHAVKKLERIILENYG